MPHFSSNLSTGKIIFAVLTLIILMFGELGEYLNPFLQYQRHEILNGQLWRLLTAHFVHLGRVHTLMNVLALCLVLNIFGRLISQKAWWASTTFISVFISLMFILFNPNLNFYAGLSGVIHGLLMTGLIISLAHHRRRKVSVFILLLMLGKIVHEQTDYYKSDYLQTLMNAPVIVDAHLYGSAIGFTLGLFFLKKVQNVIE